MMIGFQAFSQFERDDIIVQQTNEGLASARARV